MTVSRNPHGRVAGIFGEQVQTRNARTRAHYPGTVVGSHHVVRVEYNDLDGTGPYTIDHDVHDLERAFKERCEAQIDHDRLGVIACNTFVDHWGDCPNARNHIKEN